MGIFDIWAPRTGLVRREGLCSPLQKMFVIVPWISLPNEEAIGRISIFDSTEALGVGYSDFGLLCVCPENEK